MEKGDFCGGSNGDPCLKTKTTPKDGFCIPHGILRSAHLRAHRWVSCCAKSSS